MKTAPLPFQLGEISGVFKNKLEQSLVLMLKIIVKMVRTDIINRKYAGEMFHLLVLFSHLRKEMWRSYTVTNMALNEDRISDLTDQFFKENDVLKMIVSMCKDEMLVEP